VTKNCGLATIDLSAGSFSVSGLVTNCGSTALANVTVTDTVTNNGVVTTLTVLSGATIPPQGSVAVPAFSIPVTVCGPVRDFLTVTASGPCGNVTNRSAVCTTTVTNQACVGVTKNCGQTPIDLAAGSFTVSGVVTNCGNTALANVTVTDTVTNNGAVTTITVLSGATIPAQGSIAVPSFSIPVTVCGPVSDFLTVTASGPCGNVTNRSGVCVTTVTNVACIGVAKLCGPALNDLAAGPFSVQGIVTNCGTMPLTGIVVVDTITNVDGTVTTLTNTVAGPLAPSATATVTFTNVPSLCGAISDFLTATGNGPCGPASSVSPVCTTQITNTPCLTVVRTCTPTTLTNCGTTPLTYTVSGVVSNCGAFAVTGVTVLDTATDANGVVTLSSNTIPVVAAHSIAAIPTMVVPAAGCGTNSDYLTVTGTGICGQPVSATSQTCATVLVCPPPQICVTKGITCAPATGVAGCDETLTYGSIATGVAGSNQSAFCYQVIVSNCCCQTLTNVQVVDNLLDIGGKFPTTLLPGQSATNYYGQSYGLSNGKTSSNVNTVRACGVGVLQGLQTCASASATAVVVPASVQCTLAVTNAFNMDNPIVPTHVLLPSNAPVTLLLTIQNTGMADLNVAIGNLPPLVSCADDTNMITLPSTIFLPAGQSTTLSGCFDVECTNTPVQFNVSVQGTVVASASVPCIYDAAGNVVSTALSSKNCAASVECQAPVSCRTTGGGDLIPGTSSTNCVVYTTTLIDSMQPDGLVLDHVSHGGQLGAPFSQMDCATRLGNPCIRGEWQHVRHYGGNGKSSADVIDMQFHSANPQGCFDTLVCACLGCCNTNPVHQPNGNFGGIGHHFTVCNPQDHRICGPMPRPAPANALIFSGIGTFTPQDSSGNGRNSEKRYVVFRVYIEDHSEPGGAHPKGGQAPADIYCFQAWDTGIPVAKKPDFKTVATDFRAKLSADSCAFIKSIAIPDQIVNGQPVPPALPPGTMPSMVVDGMQAEIVDMGPLWNGNRQIHPSTSATCTQ
jgi:hypothetical protein